MKKILILYFSQSGQLGEILQNFTAPFKAAGHLVEEVRVFPLKPYPFPWKGNSFFSVMPDCVNGIGTELQDFTFREKKYDLIVLGYQAWFLSPSIPCSSILQHPQVQQIIHDTPVITITGARNMWISAMERIKTMLQKNNARLVGHIALVDQHPNIVSFITIFYWMLTGKKDRFMNIFPPPGVSKEDILRTSAYGETVLPFLTENNYDGLQEKLIERKAVVVKYNLMFIESKARKIFRIWANFISKRKNKELWLNVFKYYLIIALFVAAPVILTVDAILFRPFLQNRIKKQKLQYAGIK